MILLSDKHDIVAFERYCVNLCKFCTDVLAAPLSEQLKNGDRTCFAKKIPVCHDNYWMELIIRPWFMVTGH